MRNLERFSRPNTRSRRRNPERSSRPHTRSRTLVDGPPSPTPEEEPEDKFSLVRKSRYYEEDDEPVSQITKESAHLVTFFTFHQIYSIGSNCILIDYVYFIQSPVAAPSTVPRLSLMKCVLWMTSRSQSCRTSATTCERKCTTASLQVPLSL